MTTSSHQHKIILEVCVDSVESAIAAQEGGAARVELCANLTEGGTTPSAGMIELVRKNISIGLHAIIRPRAGDFCYSDVEFEVMMQDIVLSKQLGADGVVFGILNRDNSVDIERMRRLVNAARPMSITFHRAFDVVSDPFAALEEIIDLGINRILTSGQKASALAGLDLISKLVIRACGRIIIMPGSGITQQNIKRIVEHTAAKEVHVGSTARITRNSSQISRADFSMGSNFVTDAQLVKRLIQAAQ